MMVVVAYPASSGMRTALPPRASTMSRPTMASAGQSAPFTRTSGCSAAMRSCGVSTSKITTASTHASAATTSARSACAEIGRAGPLFARTDRSELRPTISGWPRARACCRYRTCPGWSRSKTPLVKAIVLPAARNRATSAAASGMVTAWLELHRRRKGPPMARSVDADVVDGRLQAERVEQAVIVVGEAVALVDRDVDLVGALDEIEAVDGKRRFGLAAQMLRVHLLEIRVGAIAADAVRVEEADAEHEVVGRLRCARPDADRQRLAGVKHERRLSAAVEECDVADLHVARSPPPLAGLERVGGRIDRVLGLPFPPFRPLPPFRLFPPCLFDGTLRRGRHQLLFAFFHFRQVGADDTLWISMAHGMAPVD